jgi:ubiquinone/menaquinone biosynthesis C-methylase UbiE
MLTRIVESHGTRLEDCRRILELGCGAGRMTRWLADSAAEIWGADVSAQHILWCERHLSPPFRFVTTTSCPHLPFADEYFDLVYAGSVFTHVSDLVVAWLLELRRIMRTGAHAYLTIHDRHTVDFLQSHPGRPLGRRLAALPTELQFWKSEFGMATVGRGFGSLVFYDERFIRQRWGRLFEVVSITPEAYDCQSAVLLAKSDETHLKSVTSTTGSL